MMKERLLVSSRPDGLTVVYDGGCLLCRRSVHWLEGQRQAVPMEIVPSSSGDAVARFGHLPDYGDDMIVAADDGRVWAGPPDAYLVVMWALPLLRPLSYVLSIRPLKPLAGRVFQLVTGNRQAIGGWLLSDAGCEHCSAGAGSELSEPRQL
jgi:predicted DCC family thiol-disulfide oxidoreductase YuxK